MHSCIYCLDEETLILMHDGTTKLLRDLKVGDKIYGVRKDESTGYYYYEVTEVLAHWKTVKPAIKIVTEEGIEVVCSPDHRWLSASRGWKYTLGRMSGLLRRPYLTKNNAIQGIGKLLMAPKETDLYMRGYLSGIIRGDGLLKSYDYSGRRRNKDIQYQFRLALDDKEAVMRAYNYLDKFGIKTNWFKFEISNNNPVDAIRINSKESYQKIKKLINFNSKPEYLRGFAAGIFDAEGAGGSDSSTIRILNTDTPLLEFTRKSLKNFGFHIINDKPNKNTNCKTIRIRGGLEEYIRFFQTMNPAIKRKIVLEGKQVKKSFRIKEIIDLNEIREMHDITTGTRTFIANGLVSHNCYARFMKRFTNHHEPWGKFLDVKINAVELIPKNTKKYKNKSIMISSVTDPYQPAEKKYKLMRGILENLIPLEPNLCVMTKSDLITRDIDLLKRFKDCIAGVSLSLLDDKIRKEVEPFASSVERRIEAVKQLKKAGIRTFIFISPMFPELTDWKGIIAKTKKFVDEYWFENLNLYPSLQDNIFQWLKNHHPKLVKEYQKIYFTKNDYWDQIEREIEKYSEKNHLNFTIYFHHQKL
jgi:DNA repair photolyase